MDDVFWAGTDAVLPDGQQVCCWMQGVLAEVVTDLCGWQLDPMKTCVGRELVILGLAVRVESGCSYWSAGGAKVARWISDLREVITGQLPYAWAGREVVWQACLPEHPLVQQGWAGFAAALDLAAKTSLRPDIFDSSVARGSVMVPCCFGEGR